MNAVRTMSGTADKLSVNDVTMITSSAGQWGVRTPNLFPAGSNVKKEAGNWILCQNVPATAGKTYSASLYVNNTSEDIQLRLTGYAPGWKVVGDGYGNYVEKGQSGTARTQVKVTSNCNLVLRIVSKVNSFDVDFSKVMLNEGDYAPYTSATKPYTVDELANRLEKLENKLGGVINLAISTFKRIVIPLMGGVSYVA